MAHDFNNLLTVVVGHAEVLRASLGERADDELDHIVEAARTASGLCRQMLLFAGGVKLAREPVDINQVIVDMRELLASIVMPNALVTRLDGDGSLITWADPTHLQQVVLNLVQNAADSIEESGTTVTIRTGVSAMSEQDIRRLRSIDAPRPGDHVWFEVSDDGPGLSSGEEQRLFDPFFSTKGVGRGMGLATVMRIVSEHKGGIAVHAPAGRGLTVRVCFPSSTTSQGLREGDLASSTDPIPEGLHVLLVDDQEGVRRSVTAMLRQLGAVVEAFADGKEALESVEEDPSRFGVAVIDLSMPRISGAQVIERLLAQRPEQPILAMSGYSAEKLPPAISEEASVRFLAKPFDLDALARALARLVTTSAPAGGAR